MRGRGMSLALVCTAALASASCTYLLGLEDLGIETAGTGAGGAGAGGAGGAGGGTTTTSSGPTTSGGGTGGEGGASCGGRFEVLASGQSNPTGIVVHGSSAYWINSGNSVMMAGISGSPDPGAVFDSTLPGIVQIAVSTTDVYAQVSNKIHRASLPGPSSPTQVANVDDVGNIAADDTTFYWWNSVGTTIYRDVGELVANNQNALRDIVVQRELGALFWITDASLLTVSTSGGSATPLRTGLTIGATRLAVDANFVYWFDESGTQILSNDVAAPDTAGVTVEGVTGVLDLEAIDGKVYWIEGGDIVKWDGASKAVLYSDVEATSIALNSSDMNDSNIYWTTSTPGCVMKAMR